VSNDRYARIREALPILIAEAQAKGGRNERAALIVELLEERDAQQAEIERLREQLRLVLRDAAPAVQGEPVAYISQEDFEFIRSDDMSEQYGTRQAPVFSRKDYRVSVPLYASPQPPAPDVEALAEALECMIIGACAVAVPHNGERAVLQDAVNIARAALAAYRKGGKQ